VQEGAREGIALTDLNPSEIASTFDIKPFQGRQVFQWIHRKAATGFESMTNLSKALRARLEVQALVRQTVLEHTELSPKSGTRKVLVGLRDGENVEAVLLRDRNRTTLCLSSQVGCELGCPFCATGQAGFKRNLTPGEIVEQALHLLAEDDLGERTPNIVYMGMGEPFRNYDAVAKSIRLLMDPDGLAIGARKITVSTVGETEGIRRFTGENWQVRLAVSLHAANDVLRSKLVPLNRTHPLPELMKAIEYYIATTGRQMSFEWTLLQGVNDSDEQAEELASLIGDLGASVNLIPFNAVEGSEFEAPSRKRCRAFRDRLTARGIRTMLRLERGGDIDAACGQLRRRHGRA